MYFPDNRGGTIYNYLKQFISIRFLEDYFLNFNRLEKIDNKQLFELQNKKFVNTINYALKVPLYKSKYKNIEKSALTNIKNINKLPTISKQDLRTGFPKNIVPANFNIKKGLIAKTGGSTGEPVRIIFEPYLQIRYYISWLRILKYYKINWKKNKIMIIAERDEYFRYNSNINDDRLEFFEDFYLLKNKIKTVKATEKTNILFKKIQEFKPDIIVGSPGILYSLSIFKANHFFQYSPKKIFSSGSVLNNYFRNVIENNFETDVVDVYCATEGDLIAFECPCGNYHVLSDIVYLELLDKFNHRIDVDEFGKIILTRFGGNGTPIIRYTGLNDIAKYLDKTCSCGITSQIIGKIEGRKSDCIVFSDGRILPPFTFWNILISNLSRESWFKEIKKFRVIQKKIDSIEIIIFFYYKYDTEKNNEIILKIKNLYQNILQNYFYIDVKIKKEDNKLNQNQNSSSIINENFRDMIKNFDFWY
mgnify:CR=1 FL=1